MSRKMKDSGVEWIGEIPEDWDTVKLRRIGDFTASGINKEIHDNEVPVKIINYIDIYRNGNMVLDSRKEYMEVTCEPDRRSNNLVEVGDIIFTPSSETIEEIGMSAVVYETIPNLSFSYHVLRYHPKKEFDLAFKKYMMNNHLMYNYFSSRAVGTIRKTLNREDFKSALAIVPPLDEQYKLGKFLDDKCSKIDHIITKTQASIEEYKRYKQSIITEAVTKGLDPNVPMKDSGIEWIGSVPLTWKVTRLKFNYRIVGGNGFSLDLQGNTTGDLPFCKASDIGASNGRMDRAANYVSYDIAKKHNFNIIPKGSVAFPKIGEAMKKNNRALCMVPCCLDNNCQAVVPHEMDELYSFYLLLCIDMSWFDNAGTIPSINNSKLLSCFIAHPPLDEQVLIGDFLERKCLEIDEVIEAKQFYIASLNEYKKSLIYEVVTGKKEVM